MALNVSQMAWLNQNTDPVAVMTKALAAKAQQASSELAARSLMQDQQQFAQRQAMAVAQAQAARDQFLEELAFKREVAAQQAQQAIAETTFKQGLAERNFGLDAAENDRKAAIASMQFQGQMDYETLVRSGVPPVEALKQTLSKLAVGNPNALASAVNRDEVNALRTDRDFMTNLLAKERLAQGDRRIDATENQGAAKLAQTDAKADPFSAENREAQRLKFMSTTVDNLMDLMVPEKEAVTRAAIAWNNLLKTGEIPGLRDTPVSPLPLAPGPTDTAPTVTMPRIILNPNTGKYEYHK